MVVAVTQTILAGQTQSRDALVEDRAIALGEALLEEIMTQPYVDPDGDTTLGPDTAEDSNDRSTFDAIDDFHSYAEAATALVDAGGTAYPELFQIFSRSVAITQGDVTVSGFADPQPAMTVVITVQEGNGRSWTITRVIPEPEV